VFEPNISDILLQEIKVIFAILLYITLIFTEMVPIEFQISADPSLRVDKLVKPLLPSFVGILQLLTTTEKLPFEHK
jgi:hypothetical protein